MENYIQNDMIENLSFCIRQIEKCHQRTISKITHVQFYLFRHIKPFIFGILSFIGDYKSKTWLGRVFLTAQLSRDFHTPTALYHNDIPANDTKGRVFKPTTFPRRRRGLNPGHPAQKASALITRLPCFLPQERFSIAKSRAKRKVRSKKLIKRHNYVKGRIFCRLTDCTYL